MANTLWEKDGHQLHPLIEEYTVGDDAVFDQKLLPYDLAASAAHVKGLAHTGILTEEEQQRLLAGIESLRKDWAEGRLTVSREDEDCHTAIERHLTETLGDLGKKIHTGRSRNDQVAVALRLCMKDLLAQTRKRAGVLAVRFFSFAQQHRDVPIPGYTHTQQAMLSSVGHYFCSYLESLLDDIEFLDSIRVQIDKNPLGSAAGFGVALPLDRELTTRELGFGRTQVNSLYCQTSRGKFELLFLDALSQIMRTASICATDMILFTSREFDFFDADNACVTGSSIMPQKRNMDGLEIVRANSTVVRGYRGIVADIAHNLISGYHRDFQLTKKYLFESAEITMRSLEVLRVYTQHLTPREDRIRSKISPGIFSADAAIAMAAREGIPFRDAYLKAYEQLTAALPDLTESVRLKISAGAPGNLMLDHYAARLRELGYAV